MSFCAWHLSGFSVRSRFNLQVPKTCPNVDSKILMPNKTWFLGHDCDYDFGCQHIIPLPSCCPGVSSLYHLYATSRL